MSKSIPKNKITAIMVVYNEEDIIRRALESIKGVVDEILILHDGPCKDNTIKICREYTRKVFKTKKRAGVPGLILPILFRKVKTNWILKIDADEVLSLELAKNLYRLVNKKNISAYTVLWPFTDKNGVKITKNWPRKMPLYRKDKMHYFGFPHWDDPKIDGEIVETNYILHHLPRGGAIPTLAQIKEKTLGRYARLHAEYTLQPFESFDSFQYNKVEFPIHFKIRKNFPLLSAVPFALLAFFKNTFSNGAWKEGWPALQESLQDLIYYPAVGYFVYRLKTGKLKYKFIK
jgi:glycosyltransferase involved in cell wall biosynthesis